MVNPYDGLTSFQQALLDGQIRVQQGAVDPTLFVHLDHPNGETRITYVTLRHQTVTAFVTLLPAEPVEGVPCFQIGYAVPERFRGKGNAKRLVTAAITELRQGLARNGIVSFYVEAVVGVDNEASKRVAAATISTTPVEGTDSFSGVPALQYLRNIE